MNPRSLKAILADHLEEKSISVEQLAAKTGVPEHYVKAIFDNQSERLPALPYIRGYLLAIADYLGIDHEVVLEAYRAELGAKMSGPADRLPGNRFALVKRQRKWMWFAAAGIVGVLVLYAVLRSAFFGAPYFRLVNPPQDAEMFEVTGSTILLAGTTEPNGKLSINGESVPVRSDGAFQNVPVSAGRSSCQNHLSATRWAATWCNHAPSLAPSLAFPGRGPDSRVSRGRHSSGRWRQAPATDARGASGAATRSMRRAPQRKGEAARVRVRVQGKCSSYQRDTRGGNIARTRLRERQPVPHRSAVPTRMASRGCASSACATGTCA